jgi:hypothetical protein
MKVKADTGKSIIYTECNLKELFPLETLDAARREKHNWLWWLSGKAKDLEDVALMKVQEQTDQSAKRLERVRGAEAAQQGDALDVSR